MNGKRIVGTAGAPTAIGHYSQGVVAQGLVFVSGQLGLVPGSGQLAGPDVQAQTRRCLENIRAVLEAAGSSLAKAVKVTVFLKDIGTFDAMNQVYGEFFPTAPPARATVEVARLPRDGLVEIECVALA